MLTLFQDEVGRAICHDVVPNKDWRVPSKHLFPPSHPGTTEVHECGMCALRMVDWHCWQWRECADCKQEVCCQCVEWQRIQIICSLCNAPTDGDHGTCGCGRMTRPEPRRCKWCLFLFWLENAIEVSKNPYSPGSNKRTWFDQNVAIRSQHLSRTLHYLRRYYRDIYTFVVSKDVVVDILLAYIFPKQLLDQCAALLSNQLDVVAVAQLTFDQLYNRYTPDYNVY